LPQDWGKKVVTILPYLLGAILKRGLAAMRRHGRCWRQAGAAWKIGGQFRSITATFAIMGSRDGILIEKQGACH
jgi:hypothetical protein